MIRYLHKIKFGQTEREDGTCLAQGEERDTDDGGIVFILVPILVFALLRPAALTQSSIQIVILAYVGYGLIGFIDDYLIVVTKNNEGLRPGVKFALQSLLAVVFFLMYRTTASTEVIPAAGGLAL